MNTRRKLATGTLLLSLPFIIAGGVLLAITIAVGWHGFQQGMREAREARTGLRWAAEVKARPLDSPSR